MSSASPIESESTRLPDLGILITQLHPAARALELAFHPDDLVLKGLGLGLLDDIDFVKALPALEPYALVSIKILAAQSSSRMRGSVRSSEMKSRRAISAISKLPGT